MTSIEPQPAVPPPSPRFQFTLRTLLLLFVVLASSLAVFRGAAIVIFPIVLGLALVVNRVRSSSAIDSIAGAMCCVIGLFLVWWLLPKIGAPREGARRSVCFNRFQCIAKALKDYHKASGCYPPAYTADGNGKPLHSWRTLLLPYLESDRALENDHAYKSLDLKEPWDSPRNEQALAFQPREFFCWSDPSSRAPGSRQANYLAVVGQNAAWSGDKPKKLSDFGANAARTIMIIEVAESGVNWTQPEDFSLDALPTVGNAPRVFSRHAREEGFFVIDDGCSGVCVLLADGSLGYLPTEYLSPGKLRQLLQIGGYKAEEVSNSADIPYDVTHRPNWPNIAALAVWLVSVGLLLTRAVRSKNPLPATINTL